MILLMEHIGVPRSLVVREQSLGTEKRHKINWKLVPCAHDHTNVKKQALKYRQKPRN